MRTALLVGLFMVGCTDVEAIDPSREETENVVDGEIFAIPVYDEEDQGRFLIGNGPDAIVDYVNSPDHFYVDPSLGGYTTSIVGGELFVAKNGLPVPTEQLVLTSPGGRNIRIDGVGTEVFGGATGKVYHLVEDTATGPVPFCKDSGYAVAMQGVWSRTGFHRNTYGTTYITFGCRDAVSYKCFTWGYVPGPPGTPESNVHLACTRMARFDACGDGIARTREKTPIVIRDFIQNRYHPHPYATPALQHAKAMPPPPDRHFFEAIWIAEENKGAICLERSRWASLPVGFSCPSGLKDPRTTLGQQYCEDLMQSDLLDEMNPLLASASKTQDMYLHRWRNGAGDVVSTVRGWNGLGNDFKEPFNGYDHYIGSDGILLRNLPHSLNADPNKGTVDVVEVFSTGTTDRVLQPVPFLTRDNPLFEGYLLKFNGGDRVPFNRYSRLDTNGNVIDQLTSVDPKDNRFGNPTGQLHYVITP